MHPVAGAAELAYDPNQVRYPKGHPQGGKWAPTGAATSSLAEPDSGFTRAAFDLKPVKSGWAVALGGTDRLVVAADAYHRNGRPTARLKQLVKDRLNAATSTPVPDGTTRALGAWHNPADGKIEINVTAVFPANEYDRALAYAQDQDQISMANLDAITAEDWDNAIVDTGGTGGVRDVDEDLAVRVFRIEQFHLKGTENDHDQSTHAGGSGGLPAPGHNAYARRESYPAITGDDAYEAARLWSDPGGLGGRVFNERGELPYVAMTEAANRAVRGLEVKVTEESRLGIGLLNGMPDAPRTEVPHYRALSREFKPERGIDALVSATPDLDLAVSEYLPRRGGGALIRFEPGTPHVETFAGTWGQTHESIISGDFEFTRVDPNDLTEAEMFATYDLNTGDSTPVFSAAWKDYL